MKIVLLAIACTIPLLAHAGELPEPHDLWTLWVFDPGVVLPLLISALLYGRGTPKTVGLRLWEIACWWSGWFLLAVALISPLHPVGEVLFSAHMVQHEILMVAAAPLLVLGRPLVVFLWALPFEWRRTAGTVTRFAAWTSKAGPATLIHGAILWIWHFPPLFELTLRSDLAHSLQHISFLFSALLFWWALLRTEARGSATFYLFATTIHTSILGALLTFSASLWYPAYSGRTDAWGFTALEDQQLGGLIMWVPASISYIVAGLIMAGRWLQVTALLALFLTGCEYETRVQAFEIAGGNWRAGRDKIQYYGCGSCHTIPGVTAADGLVGPPLTKFAKRMYIGGVLQNHPDNLVRWIQDPKGVDKLTAMPNLNVTGDDARDIATFLYTLQ